MPARRAHRKSRGGCDQCKVRRVKCNEAGPPCTNCVVRELTCSYVKAAKCITEPNRQHLLHDDSDRGSENSITSHARPSPAATSDSNHTLELELMHYYSISTSLTFCNNTGPDQERQRRERYLFQEYLPRESLRCRFVLHVMFAVTALHLSTSVDALRAPYYLKVAMEYQNSSYALFREAIMGLDQHNCHLVLAASFGYLMLSIATPDLASNGIGLQSVKTGILSALKLMKGPIEIYRTHRSTLASSPFSAILEPKSMNSFAECDYNFKSAFERLRRLSRNDGALPLRQLEPINIYLIDELENSTRRSRDGIPIAGLSWLTLLPDLFVSAIEQSEVVPSLILAHLGVLLDQSLGVWWSIKSGKALVAEICSVFSDLGGEEHEALAWCRRQVGLVT